MTRVTTQSVNLTDHQAEVLIKLHTASTPHLAKAETEAGEKAIAAAGILKDIGAITIDAEGAYVTDIGQKIMQDEGLVDGSGQLTNRAQQYAAMDSEGQAGPPPEQADSFGGMGGDLGGMGGDLGGMDLGDEDLEGEFGDLGDEEMDLDDEDPEDPEDPEESRFESWSMIHEMNNLSNLTK